MRVRAHSASLMRPVHNPHGVMTLVRFATVPDDSRARQMSVEEGQLDVSLLLVAELYL